MTMSLATPEKIQTLQRKLCLKAKREQDIVHASRMNLVREPVAGIRMSGSLSGERNRSGWPA